jgi:hypothetical protein
MDGGQQLFNIVVAIAGTLCGWWMKVMWEGLKDLQAADKALADKVASIEVLVAGNYVKREDLTELRKEMREGFAQVTATLNTTFERIEKKADK